MNHTNRLTPKLPDRPPTWTEVGLSGLVTVWIVSRVWPFEDVSWTAVALGILATWLVAGPLAKSSIGRRIDAWGEEAALGPSIVVLVCVAIVVLATFVWLVPSRLESGLVAGLLVATNGWFLVHFVSAGEVSGWS